MKLLRQRHANPHYECTTEAGCDALDETSLGHICSCSCKRCSLFIGEVEVCICTGCDARSCGLHATAPPC